MKESCLTQHKSSMAASALHSVPMFLLPFSHKTPKPIHSLCFNPPSITLSRLAFHSQSPFSSCASVFAPKHGHRVFRVYGLLGDDSPQSPNSEPVSHLFFYQKEFNFMTLSYSWPCHEFLIRLCLDKIFREQFSVINGGKGGSTKFCHEFLIRVCLYFLLLK